MNKQEEYLKSIGAEITPIVPEIAEVTVKALINIPKGAQLITYKNGGTALLIDGEIYKPDLNFYTRNFADDLDNDKTVSPKEIGCEVLDIMNEKVEILNKIK